MKNPHGYATSPLTSPHCPICHCAWFSTISGTSGPVSEWTRKCKNCGIEYSTNESLMLSVTMEGEANHEAVVRHTITGNVSVVQRTTRDELEASLNGFNDIEIILLRQLRVVDRTKIR